MTIEEKKKYQKQYRDAHKEQIRRSAKKWALKNREKIAEKSREYRKNNPEKCRESVIKWQKNNPEKVKASAKKWRKNNPEKCSYLTKKWRSEHPDVYIAQMDKDNEKNKKRRIQSSLKNKQKFRGRLISKVCRLEIARLLLRGKNPADIAICYNIPLSVIDQLRNAQATISAGQTPGTVSGS